jgi:hypothetical protein
MSIPVENVIKGSWIPFLKWEMPTQYGRPWQFKGNVVDHLGGSESLLDNKLDLKMLPLLG